MEFVKLQKEDIIKIEKGMKILAITPHPLLCDEFSVNTCIVGETVDYSLPTHNKVTKFEDALEKLLINFDVPIHLPKYKEEMENFIKKLELKRKHTIFDTKIYEGEYEVYFVEHNKNGHNLVHCKKLDTPLITIKFYPDLVENSNVKILTNAKTNE